MVVGIPRVPVPVWIRSCTCPGRRHASTPPSPQQTISYLLFRSQCTRHTSFSPCPVPWVPSLGEAPLCARQVRWHTPHGACELHEARPSPPRPSLYPLPQTALSTGSSGSSPFPSMASGAPVGLVWPAVQPHLTRRAQQLRPKTPKTSLGPFLSGRGLCKHIP